MIRILLLFFVVHLSLVSFAQYHNPEKVIRDSINSITKQNIIDDIDEYSKNLSKLHIHPFTYISKSDFFDRLQAIKDSADKYDVDQLLIQLLKVNALIGDEHTNIEYISRDVYPFWCYWFEEGIYITGTDNDNRQFLFSRVIAVNDIPINEVTERISTLVPDKNIPAIKEFVPRYLFDPFVIHGLQVSPHRNDAVYTLVDEKNDTVKVSPEAVDVRSIKTSRGFDRNIFLRYGNSHHYWYKYFDSGNYIYFRYASCYEEPGHPFRKMEKELVDEIDARKPQKIIIDMRDNGGGYPRMLKPFMNSLSRSELNKKGRIYVLIGRKTFSTGLLNSVYIKDHTYATLVGEETSGSVVHFGAVQWFLLPETKLRVMYSTQYVATDETYDGSLRPAIKIPETFADYKRGVDSALQYAITH